jgi:hypothetical protein
MLQAFRGGRIEFVFGYEFSRGWEKCACDGVQAEGASTDANTDATTDASTDASTDAITDATTDATTDASPDGKIRN